ncbi:MAG: SAM-dependent methyltransferase [Gammaproteobacteria bacterium]|nr:MAG: SAM-dependent methyltransferase [Gammaproteobacteria bacterium]
MSNRTLQLTDRVYDYLLAHSLKETPIQLRLRQETAGMEMSAMQIAPEQGQFMAFLIRLIGACKVLEIGVYTGYSSLAVAYALPSDGKLIACDINPEWTAVAQGFWQQAGVADKIDLRLAPASETLADLLKHNQHASFDFIFIDADKTGYDHYFEQALKLVRSGGLILIDNTLWGGDVADPSVQDADTLAIRTLNKKLVDDKRVDVCMLPVADGLTLIRKK